MEILVIPLAAGDNRFFQKAGRYLEIIESSGPITIDLYDAAGSNADDAVNALSGLYMEGAFSAFNIYSATAQNIKLLITDGRGGSRRQPGIVSVLDSAFERVIAEQAYACRISLPAVAGQWGVASIYNPTGSGRRVSVTRINVGTNTPGIASICTWAGNVAGGIAQTCVNKRRGGAANAVTIICMGGVAAQAGSPILSGFFSSQLSSMILAEPIVLEPGQAVALQADTQNMQLLGGIEFTELAI